MIREQLTNLSKEVLRQLLPGMQLLSHKINRKPQLTIASTKKYQELVDVLSQSEHYFLIQQS